MTDFRNPSGSHGPVGEEYRRNNETTIEHIDHNSARFRSFKLPLFVVGCVFFCFHP